MEAPAKGANHETHPGDIHCPRPNGGGRQHRTKNVPADVQKALIALDREWGEAGDDVAKLDKVIGDSVLAIGAKGEAQDKQQLIASNKSASAGVSNGTYTADEYTFDMPSSDVVVMAHRGATKGMQNGKEVTESHRSLHVFQKTEWPVAGSGQRAIADPTIEQIKRAIAELQDGRPATHLGRKFGRSAISEAGQPI